MGRFLAAVFYPVVLFALFWRRSNWQGALAGMISGGAMVFIWKYLVRPLGGVWNIYELLPGFQRIMPYDRHCKPAHKSTFKRDHRRIRPGLGS